MDDNQFHILFSSAVALPTSDRAGYIDYWMRRGYEMDLDDIPDDADPDLYLADQLEKIWDVAHLSVRDMRHHARMTQTEFADHFCMPMRTVQNWEGGKNACSPAIRLLMAESLGLFDRKKL